MALRALLWDLQDQTELELGPEGWGSLEGPREGPPGERESMRKGPEVGISLAESEESGWTGGEGSYVGGE